MLLEQSTKTSTTKWTWGEWDRVFDNWKTNHRYISIWSYSNWRWNKTFAERRSNNISHESFEYYRSVNWRQLLFHLKVAQSNVEGKSTVFGCSEKNNTLKYNFVKRPVTIIVQNKNMFWAQNVANFRVQYSALAKFYYSYCITTYKTIAFRWRLVLESQNRSVYRYSFAGSFFFTDTFQIKNTTSNEPAETRFWKTSICFTMEKSNILRPVF